MVARQSFSTSAGESNSPLWSHASPALTGEPKHPKVVRHSSCTSVPAASEQRGATTRTPSPDTSDSCTDMSELLEVPPKDVARVKPDDVMTASELTKAMDMQIMNMSSAFEHSISLLHHHQRRSLPKTFQAKTIPNFNAAGTCVKKQPRLKEDIDVVHTRLKELQHKVEFQQKQQLEYIAKTEQRLAALEQGMIADFSAITSESPTIKNREQDSELLESPCCNCAAATALLTSSTEALSQKIAKLQMDAASLSLKLLDLSQEGRALGCSDTTLSGQRQESETSERNARQSPTKVFPSPGRRHDTSMPPAVMPIDNPHSAVQRMASIPSCVQTDGMIATNQVRSFSYGSPRVPRRHDQHCAPNSVRPLTLKVPQEMTSNTGAPHQAPLRSSSNSMHTCLAQCVR